MDSFPCWLSILSRAVGLGARGTVVSGQMLELLLNKTSYSKCLLDQVLFKPAYEHIYMHTQ